jgi:transposase-like protein
MLVFATSGVAMRKRGPKPRFLDLACPNEQCMLFGIAGKGNVTCYGTYMINSGKVRKYICHTCGIRFCDRTNTAFYDIRTSEDKVQLAIEMVTKGMSIQGISDVLKSKPSTIRRWISKASSHCEKVNETVLKNVETPKVEMDELWTIVGEKEFPETVNMATKGRGSG